MANTESKKLAVDVIARIDKLEKGMAKAASATKAGTDKMRRSTEQAATAMERSMAGAASKIGQHGIAMAKSFAAPLLALGAAGLIQQVGAIANSIATVGDEAKRAGVAVEVLQELGAVAKANRIPIDAMVDGLKEMALRGDEFVFSNGESGSAAEAFTLLGYSADDLKEKLKQPSELFTEIIGKLGQLDQAAQIRIADEIFGGTGGERFVQLIDQGEAGLRSTIQTARDLGQVMDEQIIARAADLDRAFNDVATTVSTNLQQAIVNASYALFDFLQQFQAMEDRTTNSLEERLNGLGRDIVTKDAERLKALSEARSNPGMAGLQTGFAVQLEQEIAALREEEAKILKILQDRKAPIAPPSTSTPPTVPGTGSGGGGGGRSASTVIAETDAILRYIDALQWEHDSIGISARELAVANALRQNSAGATAEQRAQIEALVASTFDARAANDQLNASLDEMTQLGESALRGFIDDLLEGKNAGEAFAGVLADIGSQLIQMGVSGLGSMFRGGIGGGGGFFPGLTGPRLFDQGGYTGAGGKYEPAGVVHRGEYVFSKEATARAGVGNLEAMHRNLKGYASGGVVGVRMPAMPVAAAKGGDSVRVEMPITIDARGADAAGLARLEQRLAVMQAEMPGRMKEIVRTHRKKW